ncbi:hypothetical protein ACJJIK_04155 [Microbulbifer sp. ZKSA006]|uniref:hypothetical protein n=1 Tax=Microbulbifer sp. ZKSA006 TaxID=3243390 RepID=UPI00403A1396
MDNGLIEFICQTQHQEMDLDLLVTNRRQFQIQLVLIKFEIYTSANHTDLQEVAAEKYSQLIENI